ncbi:MAG: radical SAM protein [Paracoccaceae bacterium]
MAAATLMLHLTGRCNLECKHCYMDGSPRRRDKLPFDWIAQAVRVAPEMGVGTLFVTGGEPMLYPGLRDLLRIASEVPDLTTTLCTNATRVQPRDADLFAELGLNVHVSIDGTPTYHDGFRASDGAFERAERGVSHLVAAGVDVTVTTTVSRENFDQFGDVVSWVEGSGATRLLVQPLLDLGRGSTIADQQLSSAQLLQLIMMTSDVANKSGKRVTASIIGGSKRFFLAHPCAAYVCNGGGCHRGVSAEIKKIVVRENGTILPESTNLDPRYAIGHVADGPLRDQIRRYFADGYAEFDRLCRTTYDEFVPDWPDPLIPWDQLLAMRSRSELPARGVLPERGCGSGLALQAALAEARA